MCVFQSVPLFFYIILFQLIKVDSQIDYLQTDSLPNSFERKLVSDLSILAQKWTKIAKQTKYFCFFATYCLWI